MTKELKRKISKIALTCVISTTALAGVITLAVKGNFIENIKSSLIGNTALVSSGNLQESITSKASLNKEEVQLLDKKQEYIKIGQKLNLKIENTEDVISSFGKTLNTSDFTWKSSNEKVAKVNQNGEVTGAGIGYATIIAEEKETKIKSMMEINVYRDEQSAIAVPSIVYGDSFAVALKEDGTVWASRKK